METNISWRFQIYYPKGEEKEEIEDNDNNYNILFINKYSSKLGVIRQKPITISKEEVITLLKKLYYPIEQIQIYENSFQLPEFLKKFEFQCEKDPQRTRWYFNIIFNKIHNIQLEEEVEIENIKYFIKTIFIKELENNLIELYAFISRMSEPITKEDVNNELKKRFPNCVFKIINADEASACPFPND